MFCPKCGAILVPKKKGNKMAMVCNACGATNSDPENSKLSEKVVDKGPELEVIEDEPETLPVTETECPKCKHMKAYYWHVQTRASDEPATQFLKCVKCGHKWRNYD